jgi:excinuclease ABC subunit C
MNKDILLKIKNLPLSSGCYLFKDYNEKIIYIGKAKNIKKRVNSYFQKKDLDSKTKALVLNIKNIDYIATNTEVEAFLLESNLVKKYQPKYNIDLKDAKRFAYLEITSEKYPRIIVTRTRGKGKLFGPFVSSLERDNIRSFLVKTLRLRTCRRLPKKACLRHHINLCDAPCINNISSEEYNQKINIAISILEGKIDLVISDMNKLMESYSKNMEFEKALLFKNNINSLITLKDKQIVERKKVYDEDIINYYILDSKVYLLLFNAKKGILMNKHEFIFDYKNDFLEEFLSRYYSDAKIPKEIIVPKLVNKSFENYLQNIKKSSVSIIVPKQGEKKKLLDLVLKNIELTFFYDQSKLEILQKELSLNDVPEVIECIDISHLSGSLIVGSVIQFRNGIPDKSNYRRFKIKTVLDNNDFDSIKEIVKRRYKRLKEENLSFPNLIVIDGGLGQLNSALEELNKLDLKIPIISLAKKLEEIYIPNKDRPLRLDDKNSALLLLRKIRDEAHRFAIGYNKLLRSKKFKEEIK